MYFTSYYMNKTQEIYKICVFFKEAGLDKSTEVELVTFSTVSLSLITCIYIMYINIVYNLTQYIHVP